MRAKHQTKALRLLALDQLSSLKEISSFSLLAAPKKATYEEQAVGDLRWDCAGEVVRSSHTWVKTELGKVEAHCGVLEGHSDVGCGRKTESSTDSRSVYRSAVGEEHLAHHL